MAYLNATLGCVPISVPTLPTLPIVVDDMSLSYQIGINNWSMWHFFRQSSAPAGTSDSCYSILSISKRGRAGKAGKKRKTYVGSPRIRDIQNAIAARYLAHMPVGDHVCAYEPKKSTIATAEMCSNKAIVIQIDCKDFFPTIRRSWVRNLFSHYGYSREVSNILAGLLCVSESYKDSQGRVCKKYFLPQGGVASPLVSNRVADMRFDKNILALLKHTGWEYMRYSDNIYIVRDDLLPREQVDEVVKAVRRTIHQSGWRTHKVRVDLRWRRQKVLGLVVNEKANLPREEYYALKAILYNCSVNGFPAELSRANSLTKKDLISVSRFIGHLKGRLSYASQVLCDSRVAKLRGYMDTALELQKISDDAKNRISEVMLTEDVLGVLAALSKQEESKATPLIDAANESD